MPNNELFLVAVKKECRFEYYSGLSWKYYLIPSMYLKAKILYTIQASNISIKLTAQRSAKKATSKRTYGRNQKNGSEGANI